MDQTIALESFKDKFSPGEYRLLEQHLGKRKKTFQALFTAFQHDKDSLLEALKEFLPVQGSPSGVAKVSDDLSQGMNAL